MTVKHSFSDRRGLLAAMLGSLALNGASRSEARADERSAYRQVPTFDDLTTVAGQNALNIGDLIETAGFSSPGDGGGARYLVRALAVNGAGLPQLEILDRIVTPQQFGALGGGGDDSEGLRFWLAAAQSAPDSQSFALSGHYRTSRGLTATQDVDLSVNMPSSITLTQRDGWVLKCDAYHSISGATLVLRSHAAQYAGLHSTKHTPSLLENVSVVGAPIGFHSGDPTRHVSRDRITGDGRLIRCKAIDCADAGFRYQGAAATNSRIHFEDCETGGSTGSGTFGRSGVGYLLHVRDFGTAVYKGGVWTGARQARMTHAFGGGTLQIDGGHYFDIARGPTAGNGVQTVTIRGCLVERVSQVGVSVDVTHDRRTPTDAYALVANCLFRDCGTPEDGDGAALRTTGSKIFVTGNAAYDCQDNKGFGVFGFASNNDHVYVDGNLVFQSNTDEYVPFRGLNTRVVYGSNQTNARRDEGSASE